MKYIYVLLTIIGVSWPVFSQDGNNFNSYYTDPYANIVPQTPNASNFTIYGDTPVNTSSGLPTISIPIFTIEEDGVQIPISLSYHASGIQVDEFASSVGMKWTLNAGGGVYRTINDMDDFGSYQYPNGGWIRNNTISHFDQWYNTFGTIWDYDEPFYQNELNEEISEHDNYPDEFSYNFLGFSGDFMFRPNGEIIKGVSDNVIDIFGSKTGFEISDNLGNYYSFGPIEKNETYTFIYDDNILLHSIEREQDVTVSWKLMKIMTKNGKTIEFDYEDYILEYVTQPASQRLVTAYNCKTCEYYPYGCEGEGSPSFTKEIKKETRINNKSENKVISKISTSSIEVEFIYESGLLNGVTIAGWNKRLAKIIIKDKINSKQKEFLFTYGYFVGEGTENRLKLTEIQEKGFDGSLLPPYKFTYNENGHLPNRGSYSKDYKGYYNGKVNTSYLPKTVTTLDRRVGHGGSVMRHPGYELLADRYFDEDKLKIGVLEKIQYPTGGKTEFDYEVNAIGQNTNEHLLKDDNTTIIGNSPTSFFQYSGQYGTEDAPYEVFNSLVRLEDVTGQILIESLHDCPYCYEGEFPDFRVPLIHIYQWDGDDENETLDYSQIMDSKGDLILVGSLYKGQSNNPLYLGFEGNYGNGSLNGVFLLQLKIHKEVQNPVPPPPPNVSVLLTWHTKMRDGNGDYVYQQHYLGGLRVKEIRDYADGSSNPVTRKYVYDSAYTEDIYNSGYYNIMALAGQTIFSSEKMEINYEKNVRGYTYTQVQILYENGSESNGRIVETYEPKYSFKNIQGGILTGRKVYDNQDNLLSITETTYDTQYINPLTYKTPTMMDYQYIVQIDCTITPPWYIFIPKPLAGYHSGVPTYQYYENKSVPTSEKTTEFFKRGSSYYPVTTIKNYTYNNDLLITEEVIDTRYTGTLVNDEMVYTLTNNDGEVIEVEYSYPSDHSLTLPKALTISKEVKNNGLKVLGQYFVYDNYGNINKTFHYNKGQGSNTYGSYVPSDYEEINSYEFLNGKPIQVQTKGGMPVSYIWGYNNTYPVAKLEGVAYNSINNTLKDNIINATNEANLITALNALRNNYSNSLSVMITTYTYSPLVGVTSITDPKGDKVTYHYDGFGRLDHIKDADGNKLEEYEYHYRED